MTQQEIEVGEMVNTPLGCKPMSLVVAALEQYYDPKTTIAIKWGIEDVRSVRDHLTEEQCTQVLAQCERDHDASIGVNWEVIEWHICDLFGDE